MIGFSWEELIGYVVIVIVFSLIMAYDIYKK